MDTIILIDNAWISKYRRDRGIPSISYLKLQEHLLDCCDKDLSDHDQTRLYDTYAYINFDRYNKDDAYRQNCDAKKDRQDAFFETITKKAKNMQLRSGHVARRQAEAELTICCDEDGMYTDLYHDFENTRTMKPSDIKKTVRIEYDVQKGVDVMIAMDVVEICLTMPHIVTLIFLSGDSDFVPAMEFARDHGRHVVAACGPDKKWSRIARAAHQHIVLDEPALKQMLYRPS